MVDDEGDEVDEVVAYGDEGSAVADDVADELEEGEDDEEDGEGGEDETEVGGVLAHDVVVEQEGKLHAGGAAESAKDGCDVEVGLRRMIVFLAAEAGEELVNPDADGGDEREGDASSGHLIEEEGSCGGEDEVGSPDAEEGRELAVAGEGYSDGREEVVDKDEKDGEDEAGGFASALGGEAEGYADEHKDEAGEGIGESLVELDAVDAGGMAGDVVAGGAA